MYIVAIQLSIICSDCNSSVTASKLLPFLLDRRGYTPWHNRLPPSRRCPSGQTLIYSITSASNTTYVSMICTRIQEYTLLGVGDALPCRQYVLRNNITRYAIQHGKKKIKYSITVAISRITSWWLGNVYVVPNVRQKQNKIQRYYAADRIEMRYDIWAAKQNHGMLLFSRFSALYFPPILPLKCMLLYSITFDRMKGCHHTA